MPSLPSRLRRSALPALLILLVPAASARTAVRACDHLQLALDARITPQTLVQDWGTGAAHEAANAVLELRGCRGELLDRLGLAAPLARIDPQPLRGTPVPTWLVSADLSAGIGSYSGPLTLPVEIVAHRLRVARSRGPAGASAPIHLAATGKAAWRRVVSAHGDDLLSVASTMDHDAFVTTWRRYRITARGWRWTQRQAPGLWESDADFPDVAQFP
jgi:hypothetical protein